LKLGQWLAADRPKGVPGATTTEAVPALPRVYAQGGTGTLENLWASDSSEPGVAGRLDDVNRAFSMGHVSVPIYQQDATSTLWLEDQNYLGP
jgi:hypothetical protein